MLKKDSLFLSEVYENERYPDMLLRTALDIAENILKCGGTVHRAEETVERICKSIPSVSRGAFLCDYRICDFIWVGLL